METELKNTQLLGSILKYMSDGVIASDKKGFVMFMNPLAEHLTGWSEQNAIGKPLGEVFRLLDRETRTLLKLPTLRAFQQNHNLYDFPRSILVTNRGEEIPVDAVVTPIKDDKEIINGCVLIFRDISKTVVEESAALDRQKIEAIGSIAESIAHDYSNRLNIISGHASSIVDNLIPKTRAYDEALKILESAEHASGLTRRLLSVAKASNIEGEIKIERVALGEIIKNAISLLEGSFAEKQIVCKALNLDQMPYVKAEAGQLLDCLINLLHNAADAMPEGGFITIDITEKIAPNKNFVVLRIRDTGHGMSKEVLDQIFTPFFSTKPRDTSLGLGLTVVQSSIQHWGGYINVWSREGHGTSFRLFIPKAKTPVARDIRRGVHVGGESILLADDKKNLLIEAKDILRGAGYKVYTARNGEECLSVYKKHVDEIDLLIIDVVMPGKDGKEVLGHILEIDPTALIIMTSGFSREYVREYLERGAWEFIQKPLDRDHFLSLVRRVLKQKSAPKTKST